MNINKNYGGVGKSHSLQLLNNRNTMQKTISTCIISPLIDWNVEKIEWRCE